MSNSSFKNVTPTGRSARRKDREFLEKKRLAERREGFERHPLELNPLDVERSGASYIDESDRFFTDVSAEEKERKKRQQELKHSKYRTIQKADEDRQKRWKEIQDREMLKEEKRIAAKDTRNNLPSQAYDIVTLDYYDTQDGKELQEKEKRDQQRAEARKQRLIEKGTSGFNPVTGEPLHTKGGHNKNQTPLS